MGTDIKFEDAPSGAAGSSASSNTKTARFRRVLKRNPYRWAIWDDSASLLSPSKTVAMYLGAGFEATHRDTMYQRRIFVRFVPSNDKLSEDSVQFEEPDEQRNQERQNSSKSKEGKRERYAAALIARPNEWAVWAEEAASNGEASLAAKRLGSGFEGRTARLPNGRYKCWVRWVA